MGEGQVRIVGGVIVDPATPPLIQVPNVPIEPVFDAGISIAVPILQKSAVVTADLPPWKLPQAASA